MRSIDNSKHYFKLVEDNLNNLGIRRFPELLNYFLKIKEEFLECEANITPDNFFENISQVLRLDAKLFLLGEELNYIDCYPFKADEIVKLIEHDSENINKELFGYRLNEKTHISLIFNT